MDIKALIWFLGAFITIWVIVAMIPAWHAFLLESTKNADAISKFLLFFFLDPTEYVWKWILATIAGMIALFKVAG